MYQGDNEFERMLIDHPTCGCIVVEVRHHSKALDIGYDADGVPVIVRVDGELVGPNQNILLLDRHWRELINAGLVKDAEYESHKVRELEIDGEVHSIPTASYGVTSCGYDFRVTNQVITVSGAERREGAMLWNWIPVVDPKKPDSNPWVNMLTHKDKSGEYIIIPPNSFVLGVTQEWFHIPRNCVVQCIGKSTIARAGLIVIVTPWEPGWKGYVTIEVSNTSNLPVKFYIGEGVGQALMTVTGNYGPDISYADKGGKYQDQSANVTLSKY